MAYYTTQYYGRGGSCTTPGLWVRTSNELTDLGLTCQNGVGTAWGEWLWLPPAGFSATGQAVHLPDAEFVELTLGQSALLSALAGPHGLVVATRDATTLETHLVRFTSPHDPPMELTTFGDGPAYVAQGERMIFLMQVNQDLDAGEVWAVDPNTGAKRALGATPGCCPWVAAGGDFVYLVHASATPGRYTFTVFDGRTGASRQFETDAGRALAATREFLYYGDGERLYRRRHCGDEEQLVAESVLTFATDERAVYVVKGAEVFEIRH